MPRRTDISSVLVIGSGPIVIGQACEFDYSGTQACRVLKAEGLRVILVNSNPATIMTDPEFADATYVEPITPEVVEAIIAKERPDAILPTLGGQTALNTAIALDEAGVLERYGVKMIGVNTASIHLAEDREAFKGVVERCGAESARSIIAHTMDEVLAAVGDLGYPLVVRPSFTMGGLGSGIAYDEADLRRIAGAGLHYSPTTEVLLEESILGWKEYELELMRDHADNVVVVCSIENVDPVGVHTGDSVTVAPALTLTDREFQRLRDIGIAIIREVGVDTGGCNIQFAVEPSTGRVVVIEMNPRVSRSSRARLQGDGVPDRQDRREARDRLHPRRDPERHHRLHPGVASSRRSTTSSSRCRGSRSRSSRPPTPTLTTTMKSVGEAMAIGPQLHRGPREGDALDRQDGLGVPLGRRRPPTPSSTRRRSWRPSRTPTEHRLRRRAAGAPRGGGDRGATIYEATAHRPVVPRPDPPDERDRRRDRRRGRPRPATCWRCAKTARSLGRADRADPGPRRADGAASCGTPSGVRPVFKTVDTCAAEFAARTPYHYSSYDSEIGGRARASARPSSSSAPGPTGSARASSSTTRACTRPSPCARSTRPSWSTATPRRSPPTTTPPTGSTSSR